jgi:hypothetical protein
VTSSLTSVGTLTSLTVSGNILMTGTGAIDLPAGTTAQRPSPSTGMIRFNTDTAKFEGYDGGWNSIGGGSVVADDNSTNSSLYPLFTSATSGSPATINVASAKLSFNPSTGTLSATVFNSLSDITQKTNIRPIENAMGIVESLNGVKFDWLNNGEASAGLIAQEVEMVLPELVKEVDSVKTLNYNGMIGVLVEAFKEQQKQIEALIIEIELLKAQ